MDYSDGTDDSLCLGLGTRMVAFLLPQVDGTMGTYVGRSILFQAIRCAVRRGCEGSSLVHLEY
jgi:hypothetical protein